MIELKKHISPKGDEELIRAEDVFDIVSENSKRGLQHYQFLSLLEQELNYDAGHTETAFGNPDGRYLEGAVDGYCKAKGWDRIDTVDKVEIRKGSRLLYSVERPKNRYKEKMDEGL